MRRMERRMYRQGQAVTRRILLTLTAAVVLLGLLTRMKDRQSLMAETIPSPTTTPVARSYDETVETREVTLPEDCWHAIQTGVFSTQEAAAQKAGAYADRGAPGYVTRDGGKWRVFIACYGEKADATAVRDRLAEAQSVETCLHGWTCPQLRLKLSGMAGQLDVVEAGLTLHAQTAGFLRKNAEALDSGQMTAGEAADDAQSVADQVAVWASAARERFARPYPELLQELLTWAEGWESIRKQLDTAAAESSSVLSATLKLQAMALYDRHVLLRETMNNPP